MFIKHIFFFFGACGTCVRGTNSNCYFFSILHSQLTLLLLMTVIVTIIYVLTVLYPIPSSSHIPSHLRFKVTL